MKKTVQIITTIVFGLIFLINLSATLTGQEAPIADLKAEETTIEVGDEIEFEDKSENDPETWQWYFEGGDPMESMEEEVDVTYNMAGTYDVTLIVTNEWGSDTLTKEDFITVIGEVGFPPIADLKAEETTIEVGDEVEFEDKSENDPETWQWYFEGGDPMESMEEEVEVTYNMAGTYDVTLIVTNEWGSDTLTKEDFITVIGEVGFPPIADLKAEETTIEVGDEVEFEDKSENDPETWQWYFEGGDPMESMEEEVEVTYNVAGTYDVTLIVTNEWGSDTLTKEDFITVIGEVGFPPIADLKAEETTIEVGDEIEFEDKSENDPETWQWYFEGGDPMESMEEEVDVTYNMAGTYNVTLIVTNEWGSDTLTKEDFITVIGEVGFPPIADLKAEETTIEVGDEIEFEDKSENDPETWQWYFEGGDPMESMEEEVDVTYNMAGTYNVTLIVTNEWGSDTLTKEDFITVIGEVGFPPIADLKAEETTIEVGDEIEFEDKSENDPETWQWYFEGGDPMESMEEEVDVTYNMAGTYDVTLIVTNEWGSDTLTKEDFITVLGESFPPIADFEAGITEIEVGEVVLFEDKSENDPETWQWYFEGGDPMESMEEEVDVTYNMAGTYDVTLIVTNEWGSDTLIKSDYITVFEAGEPPVANFESSQTEINVGEEIDFTDLTLNDPNSWSWSFEGGEPPVSDNQNPLGILYNSPGVFNVTLVVSNESGTDSLVKENYIVVNDDSGLLADFTADQTIINEGEVVHFTDLSSGGATNWQWNIEGATPSITYVQNPVVIFNIPGTYTVSLKVSNIDGSNTEIKENYIEVTEVQVILPPGWEFSPTGVGHLMVIPLEASPTIYGDPIEVGDHIGVFYLNDFDEEVCGGAVEWNGLENLGIGAIGDNPYTNEKDGFATGEEIIWKMYSWNQQQEYPAVPTYDPNSPNQGFYEPYGASLLLDLAVGEIIELTLPQGWSGVSTPLIPAEQNIDILLAPVIDQLVILNNFFGVNWPGAGMNTLNNWDNRTGYSIKMQNEVTLPVVGTLDENILLELDMGWNYMPTLTPCETDVLSLFEGHINQVEFVREVSGFKIFWPEYGINTLSTLEPGNAYLVLTKAGFEVEFPECEGAYKSVTLSHINSINLNPDWNEVNATGESHNFVFNQNAINKLKNGDIIGVFTSGGLCAGQGEFDGKPLDIQAFGDDITTPQKDGFSEFEPISFKIYRPSEDLTIDIDPVFDSKYQQDSEYNSWFFSVISDIVLDATKINQSSFKDFDVYPNPAQDQITVSGFGEGSRVLIQDLNGKTHLIKDSIQDKIQLNISDLPNGVYLVRLVTTEQSVIRKFIKN